MADWDIVDMIANAWTGGNIQKMKNTQRNFETNQQGQGGLIQSAQASPMKPQPPSTSGPMGGPLQSADTIGHGVPRASMGRGENFMRMLLQKPALPAAGERKQKFADFPRSGYDPTQRRY